MWDQDKLTMLFGDVGLCLFFFILGAIIFGNIVNGYWRQSVIDKNCGKWVIDSKTGEKNFVITYSPKL